MLQAQNISFHAGSKLLFTDVNFTLEGKGKKIVGLIGRNGCGKSTLLKVINGDEKPDTGKVNNYREEVAYLPQQIDF